MTGSPASGDDEFGLILPGITDHQVLMSLLLRRIGAEDVLGLPPFEREPAVKAFRVWATQLARTINKGKTDEPTLDALMTPAFERSTLHMITGGEIGHRSPVPSRSPLPG